MSPVFLVLPLCNERNNPSHTHTHTHTDCFRPTWLFLHLHFDETQATVSVSCPHPLDTRWLYSYTLAELNTRFSSLHSVGVHTGDRSPAGAQHGSVCLSDPPLWLLHLSKPPGCSGHLEVQILLQGPCAGVLLHRYSEQHTPHIRKKEEKTSSMFSASSLY